MVNALHDINLNQILTKVLFILKNLKEEDKVNNNFFFSKVKIMLPFDPTGKTGPKKPLPDNVSIVEPKEETLPPNPFSETKAVKPDQAPGPVV